MLVGSAALSHTELFTAKHGWTRLVIFIFIVHGLQICLYLLRLFRRFFFFLSGRKHLEVSVQTQQLLVGLQTRAKENANESTFFSITVM